MAGEADKQPQIDPVTAILSFMAKKGGLDLSNALADPFLAYLAGTYQGVPQKSEGDIYAEFAPTLMSIQANEPEGSWRKVAASQIASGVPAYRVQENILALAQEDPSALGMLTSKEATAFIDVLASENQKAQNELTKQAEQLDPFQKAGLPGARQRYSSEDVVQMFPEAFSGVSANMQNAPANIKAMMNRIDEASKRVVMREDKPQTKKGLASEIERQQIRSTGGNEISRGMISNSIAQRYNITPDQVLKPDRTNPVHVAANNAYQKELEDSAKLVATLKTSGTSMDLGGIAKGVGGGLARLVPGYGPVVGALGALKDLYNWKPYDTTPEKKTTDTESTEPKMVVSKGAQSGVKLGTDLARMYTSRIRGGEEYNKQYAAALAEQLAGKLEQQGRTPLLDAILKQAIVSRQLRK